MPFHQTLKVESAKSPRGQFLQVREPCFGSNDRHEATEQDKHEQMNHSANQTAANQSAAEGPSMHMLSCGSIRAASMLQETMLRIHSGAHEKQYSAEVCAMCVSATFASRFGESIEFKCSLHALTPLRIPSTNIVLVPSFLSMLLRLFLSMLQQRAASTLLIARQHVHPFVGACMFSRQSDNNN
jgi:hypothetical protein